MSYETTAKKFKHCSVLCIGELEVTDRPTDQPTDIATLKAAIAARNKESKLTNNRKKLLQTLIVFWFC